MMANKPMVNFITFKVTFNDSFELFIIITFSFNLCMSHKNNIFNGCFLKHHENISSILTIFNNMLQQYVLSHIKCIYHKDLLNSTALKNEFYYVHVMTFLFKIDCSVFHDW